MTRDRRGRSAPPVRVSDPARRLADLLAPDTPLGSVHAVWPRVVGDAIAAVTTVISERDGVLEIECESAVWADELSMMEPDIRAKLNQADGDLGVESIKFRTGQ